jgi:hypothetical protein
MSIPLSQLSIITMSYHKWLICNVIKYSHNWDNYLLLQSYSIIPIDDRC